MSGRFTTTKKGANHAPGGASDYDDKYGSHYEVPSRDYGARKRNPISAADKKDRIIEFERENNTLKEKENFLMQEVTMMKTKLQRVETLMKSRARATDDIDDYDISDMQRDLKGECDDLRD